MTQEQFNALTEGTVVRIIASGKTYARTDKGTFYPTEGARNLRVAGSKTTKLAPEKIELASDAFVTKIDETPVLHGSDQTAANLVDTIISAAQDDEVVVTRKGDTKGEQDYLNTNPTAYRLTSSDRVELLNAITARVRNAHRTDGKRWVMDPTVDPATLEVNGAFKYTPAERAQLWREGLDRDRKYNIQLKAAQQATKAVEAASATPAAAKEDKPAKVRQNWEGLPPTGLIRTLASQGWTKDNLGKLMTALNLTVSDTTLNIQFNDGSKKKFGHGPALPLTADQLTRLGAAVGFKELVKN